MVHFQKTVSQPFMLMTCLCMRSFLAQVIILPYSRTYVGVWLNQKCISVNQSNCKRMTVTRLRQHSINTPTLLLNKEPIEKVNSYKYLGVTLTSDLTWSEHITNITTKSRRLVGLLYRQFCRWSNPATMFRLYVSLVRPHLDYSATPAWNPYLTKDVRSLESVQVFV